jgi:hypothetical protein
MENMTNIENATETAIATFLAGLVGFVAVGFAIVELATDGDGRFGLLVATTGGGGPVGNSLKNGMSGEGGVMSGGGGENSGGGAEVTGINNGWCRILLLGSGVSEVRENNDMNMIKKK